MKILILLLLTSCGYSARTSFQPPHDGHPDKWRCQTSTPAYAWGTKSLDIDCTGPTAEQECRDICLKEHGRQQ